MRCFREGILLKVDLKNVKNNKFSIYAFYFFLYSIIGWCLETAYAILTLGYFTKRGFLYGPLCPIYGCGALILILFFSNYKKNTAKLFFYAAIVFSIFEYAVSFLLEATLKLKCWDYTEDYFNFNGRITLLYSIAWGIIAILFTSKIHPFIRRKIDSIAKKIPVVTRYVILYSVIGIFIADIILSIIKYIKLF